MQIRGPRGAKILILGDQPTREDIIMNKPFSSGGGGILKSLLNQANLYETAYFVGNISPTPHPSGNFNNYFIDRKNFIPGPELIAHIENFKKWLLENKPNIIITIGDPVFRLITGQQSLEPFRGYVIQTNLGLEKEIKVLGTYHPNRTFAENHHKFTMTMDIRKAVNNSDDAEMPPIEKTLIPKASAEEFKSYCAWLVRVSKGENCLTDYPDGEEALSGVALDIENVIGHGCHITQVGIGHSANFAMTINLIKGKTAALPESEEFIVWDALGKLSLSKTKFIAHNGVHDIAILWMNNRILFKLGFDTMLAGQLLYPELLKSLRFLCSLCINVSPWKHIAGEETYNPEDVANTKALYNILNDRIKARGLTEILDFEISQLPLATMLQLQGVKIDLKEKERLIKEYCDSLEQTETLLEKEVAKHVDEKVNFNSPKQLTKLLYVDLGFPPQFKRRKSVKEVRKTTTNEEALIKLCQKTKSSIPRLIIAWKKTKKAIGTYIDIETSPEGNVHTSYNVGSATERFKSTDKADSKSLGRWSSSRSIILPYGPGNLQSVPEYARSMYIPFEPGHIFGSGDLITAEAEVVAYLSNNEGIIRMIERAKMLREELRYETEDKAVEALKKKLKMTDIHRYKASQLMNKPMEDITKIERQIGKVVGHSTNYDASAAVPQAQGAKIGIYEEISYWKRLMAIDARKSPSLKNWHTATRKELATNNKTLVNYFGRKRRFLGEWDADLWKAGYAFKPQSTIGDLLNKAMVSFYNQYADEVRILLQLHDGMYISYPPEKETLWLTRLKNTMLIPIEINGHNITIDVELKSGPNWRDMKGINL